MDTSFTVTLLLTGKLALYSTGILLIIGLPLAYWLAYSKYRIKVLAESLICMPMVLPPTVIGFYLLIAMSPEHAFGAFLEHNLNTRLAFSFAGILVASIIAGLPYMVQPLESGLVSLPESLREAAYTLGKGKIETFYRVLIPNIKSSLITGIALTLAHSIGEFGIVLMVGGNIPGETKIASVAIYDEVQTLNYHTANRYSLVLFLISFLLLTVIYSTNKGFHLHGPGGV
ncbi:MAG: molybdate ABC transporter permease subunit [Prevotella sp.]|jgi:molybdate transport system permease protein|nr:molybdate ABC transporter permease subunit [Prevotella sp.]MCH3995218.1 molybdate ABC transporter permease subunit [Prevotella sp.]MCI1246008.1 molybdate ABC transporter permease subunit [Prevotella sp.]